MDLLVDDMIAAPYSASPKAQTLIDRNLSRSKKYFPHQPLSGPAWSADFFLLDRSKLFNSLTSEIQNEILEQLTLSMLLESFNIEKIGIGYCGKLANIAPTIEERQLFSFMGADEATHMQWLMGYIPPSARTSYLSPILGLLEEIAAIDSPNILYYLIQVILEGWSIRHYKFLHDSCQDETLKATIKRILRDESQHHHIGKTFFCANQMTAAQQADVLDKLKAYTDMVRKGTGHTINIIEQASGGLLESQKNALLKDLRHKQVTQFKLNIFKQLMSQPGMEKMVSSLDEAGYFQAY